ncbi:hypothetical protein GGI20_000760 [Coemansia sp. BCRC 34301]|nr:hypothetical protein GGI20_000760 [Coemansia sp. BCRC 34301]
MQAVFRLILEGLAMFAGSWAAGCVPLYVRMDQSKFNLLALFGAGLLIGAALAVILPEGVETLSRSLLSHKPKSDDDMVESMNTTIGWTLVAGFSLMFLIDNVFPSAHSHADTTPDIPDNDSAACLDDIQMTPRGNDRNLGNSEFTLHDPRSHYQHNTRVDDSMTSLAVINGEEQLHSADPNDDWRPSATIHRQQPPKSQPRWRRLLGLLGSALSPRYLPSTLIGILVHSCADGLALGAAVASANAAADNGKGSGDEHSSSLEIIVFMALLLHKAPAAFGLITTLKQQGYAAYKLSVWLTVFAASAPLAALATFSIFLLAQPATSVHQEKPAGTQPWAGIVMLFSAGTFMYVAMAHTLAEAVHQAKALRAKAKSSATNVVKAHVASLSFLDIAVLLLGVILPPLVSKDHDG